VADRDQVARGVSAGSLDRVGDALDRLRLGFGHLEAERRFGLGRQDLGLLVAFRFVDLGLPDPFGLEDARLLLRLCRADRGAAVPLGPHLLLHGVADVARRVDVLERSEEHTSELQSLAYLVCGLLLEKEKTSW